MLLAQGILLIFHSHNVPRLSNSSLFLLAEILFPLIPLIVFRVRDPFWVRLATATQFKSVSPREFVPEL